MHIPFVIEETGYPLIFSLSTYLEDFVDVDVLFDTLEWSAFGSFGTEAE
jgi:hypothetical protein